MNYSYFGVSALQIEVGWVHSLEVMARKVETSLNDSEPLTPLSAPVARNSSSWLTTPVAVLIGAGIISFSILLHGGIVRIKGVTPKTGTTTTTTTTTGTTPTTTTAEAGGSVEANNQKLFAFAGEQGWDVDKFTSCVTDQKFKDEFEKDNSDALSAGVNGTPGFIVGKSGATIDGVKISGAYPYETFKAVFDGLAAGTTIDALITARAADSLEKGTATVDDDAVLGNPNAPITLIEFSDYECPFCQRHFKQVYPSIKKDYVDTGKVKIVFRDFVAVKGHDPIATVQAMAASCAREQGGDEGYYKMHDYIFANTRANGEGL